MRKKIMLILLMSLLVIVFNSFMVGASNKIGSETVEVRVNIPVVQKLEIIDSLFVDSIEEFFEYKEDGESVVIENAGSVRVKSNSNWTLELNNMTAASNYDVLVRVNGSSDWKNVSNGTGYFSGKNGSQLLKFDLKIIAKSVADFQNTLKRVEIGYTLACN